MLSDLKKYIEKNYSGSPSRFSASRINLDRQQVEYWIKQKFKICDNGDIGKVMSKKEFKVLENGDVFKIYNSKK